MEKVQPFQQMVLKQLEIHWEINEPQCLSDMTHELI